MSSLSRDLTVIAVFSGAGITLKLADYLGEKGLNPLALATAVLSGVLFGLLGRMGSEESSYALGIIVGVALGGKINRPNLLAGLVTVAATCVILGVAFHILWLVVFVTALSLFDEAGHDRLASRTGAVGLLFRYRPSLKLGTLALAAAGLVSSTVAVGFLCFDLSYEVVSRLMPRA